MLVTHKSIGQVAAPTGKVLDTEDGALVFVGGALGVEDGALVFDDGVLGVEEGVLPFVDGGLLPAAGATVGGGYDATVWAITCPRNRMFLPGSFQNT